MISLPDAEFLISRACGVEFLSRAGALVEWNGTRSSSWKVVYGVLFHGKDSLQWLVYPLVETLLEVVGGYLT